MILTVTEIWSGETGSREADGPREYTRIFRVTTNDPDHRMRELLKDARLPQIFVATYPDDDDALCVKTAATRTDKTRLVWTVNADYTTWHDDEADPRKREPEIVFESLDITKEIYEDVEGGALLNSVKDQPPDKVVVDESLWVLRVTKNVAPQLPAWILDYKDAINNDEIKIEGLTFPKFTLKMKELKIPNEVKSGGPDGDIEYVELSFALHYNQETWLIAVPNRGFNEYEIVYDGALPPPSWKAVKQPILIGSPPARPDEPQWLSPHGFAIAVLDTQKPIYIDLDSGFNWADYDPMNSIDALGMPVIAENRPVFLRYHLSKEKPFAVLPLK